MDFYKCAFICKVYNVHFTRFKTTYPRVYQEWREIRLEYLRPTYSIARDFQYK